MGLVLDQLPHLCVRCESLCGPSILSLNYFQQSYLIHIELFFSNTTVSQVNIPPEYSHVGINIFNNQICIEIPNNLFKDS